MKKSGFLLLVAAFFLVTMSISAGGIELSNAALDFDSGLFVQETKTSAGEEVVDMAYQPVDEIFADFSADSITALTGNVANYKSQIGNVGGVAVRLKYPSFRSTALVNCMNVTPGAAI
jgi:hypothetical protein